jgi:hypothetical protein
VLGRADGGKRVGGQDRVEERFMIAAQGSDSTMTLLLENMRRLTILESSSIIASYSSRRLLTMRF